TKKSHDEYRERAYIAASRRTDRSIEARLQSARMASEIHKKRTRKALRVSAEIVMNEGLYEEEEDSFPQPYRLPGRNMQTSSAEVMSRVDAYPTSRVAVSKLVSATVMERDWRENKVNQDFAQAFPHANQILSQRWSTPGFPIASPARGGRLHTPSNATSGPNLPPFHNERGHRVNGWSQSLLGVSLSELDLDDGGLSPQLLTPESKIHTETPQSQTASDFADRKPFGSVVEFRSDRYEFAAELPPNVMILMAGTSNNGYNNPIDPALYDQQRVFADTPLNNRDKMTNYSNIEHEQAIGRESHDAPGPTQGDAAYKSSVLEDQFFWDMFFNNAT
ncbi:hypothetical protein BGZ61DRAFT_370546, partial [Ilyonectria robusta]|uniref:uncharacterized protein n=1 Tax=Ilyonectria robusta TaxID=1079257 RepID=UPI001E8D3FFE